MPTDLTRIGRELAAASLDLDAVHRRIVGNASRGLSAAALLLLSDGDRLQLADLEHPDPRATWEIRHRLADSPPRLGEGASGRVADSGQAERSGGELDLPLMQEEQVVGVLSLSRAEAFSEEDEAWASELAALASLALRNARRVRRLERQLERRGRADQERLRLERQLARHDRIESLGAMAGGVAHDFNNLLVGVLGNASLALMDLEPEHPAQTAVSEIQTAAETLAELTGKLLAFSGHGRFVSGPLELSEWVHGEAFALAALSRDTLVEMDLAEGLPLFQGDPGQMGELLRALLTNAVEAGSEVVRVRAALREQRDLQEGWLPDALPPGSYLLLEVADDGPGMDEATRQKAFDPFFTTKQRSRGLGLSACLGIVRGHRGWIRLRSAPGVGTRVSVLLPPRSPMVESPPEPEAQAGRSVLVVDDEGIVRRLARRVLERAGFEVRVAATGEAGLRALQDERASLVLLDMTMPGLGGPATLASIRERWPGLPVLLTSGYTEKAALRRLGPHRPEGFLPKPWTGTDLVAAVERILEAPSTA